MTLTRLAHARSAPLRAELRSGIPDAVRRQRCGAAFTRTRSRRSSGTRGALACGVAGGLGHVDPVELVLHLRAVRCQLGELSGDEVVDLDGVPHQSDPS